jgi:hypothetical protein
VNAFDGEQWRGDRAREVVQTRSTLVRFPDASRSARRVSLIAAKLRLRTAGGRDQTTRGLPQAAQTWTCWISRVRWGFTAQDTPAHPRVYLGRLRQLIAASTNAAGSNNRQRKGSMTTGEGNKTLACCMRRRRDHVVRWHTRCLLKEPQCSVVLHSIVGDEDLEQLSHFLPSLTSLNCITLLVSLREKQVDDGSFRQWDEMPLCGLFDTSMHPLYRC